MTVARRTASIFGWALCVVLLFVMWPAKFGGWSSQTVVSGESMQPLYYTGDLVFGWKTGTYTPGDVVVFTVPKGEPGEGHQVIHRLISVDDRGVWVTQGDNKNAIDPWEPTADNFVGEAIFVIPGAGNALQWLPAGLAIFAGVIITVALWPRRPEDDEEGEALDAEHDSTGPAPVNQVVRTGSVIALVLVLGGGAAAWVGFDASPSSAAELGGITAESMAVWKLTGEQASPCLIAEVCDVPAPEVPDQAAPEPTATAPDEVNTNESPLEPSLEPSPVETPAFPEATAEPEPTTELLPADTGQLPAN